MNFPTFLFSQKTLSINAPLSDSTETHSTHRFFLHLIKVSVFFFSYYQQLHSTSSACPIACYLSVFRPKKECREAFELGICRTGGMGTKSLSVCPPLLFTTILLVPVPIEPLLLVIELEIGPLGGLGLGLGLEFLDWWSCLSGDFGTSRLRLRLAGQQEEGEGEGEEDEEKGGHALVMAVAVVVAAAGRIISASVDVE